MISTQSNRDRGVNPGIRCNDTEGGFSLIEVTAAMLIMMIAGLGIACLFTYSIHYNSGANDRALAISVAQQQVEQLRTVPFEDAILNASVGVVSNIVSNGRTYRVSKTIVDSNINVSGVPTLKTITIRIDPTGSGWARLPVILRTVRSSTTRGSN